MDAFKELGIGVIFAAISILIGMSLVNDVAESNAEVQANPDVSNATKAVADIVPLIFVVLILAGAAASIAKGAVGVYRSFG